ncbi:hypothetical protein [Methylobacterium adhaesivum]|uniref:Uncharacterized protein n=1 Tax=Methylobacterium adhaesivum TaxID=333297 RepID=A0ABT8BMQ9_9HYPH|nr:hypothetical protein [Methylobacterium adhaesivum]MDN3592509.1 hypothetical protein [Methylobacterium adhaesivum]
MISALTPNFPAQSQSNISSTNKSSDETIATLQDSPAKRKPAPIPIDTSDPTWNKYADLRKDGKLIARVFANGVTARLVGTRVSDTPVEGEDGIATMNARVKQLQELNGGTVEYFQLTQKANLSEASNSLITTQILAQNGDQASTQRPSAKSSSSPPDSIVPTSNSENYSKALDLYHLASIRVSEDLQKIYVNRVLQSNLSA